MSLFPEYFILFLQTLLYPLTNGLFPLLIPVLRQRKNFELKNFNSETSKSFKRSGEVASFCFEISSEGEFEQVAPLLIDLLKGHLKIELIFCSPSVERKVESLATQYKNLRIFRLPLLSYSCFPQWYGQSALQWSTANQIFLCRYDFFPELMIMVKKFQGKLISATLIGKKKVPWHLKRYYHFFAEILAATQSDRERFVNELGIASSQVQFLELRFIQIERRLADKKAVFDSHEVSRHYAEWLQKTPQKKLIIGSMWPVEIDLFSKHFKDAIKNQKIHVSIFPHHLSGMVYEQLVDSLKVILEDIPVVIIDEKMNANSLQAALETPSVFVFKLKGMLCEFYSLFDDAYVGGGHGRSIHSILEPFLAGPFLFCGPGTHRSTEFMVVQEATKKDVRVVEKLELFYESLIQYSKHVDFDKRISLIREMNQLYRQYFERFTKGHK